MTKWKRLLAAASGRALAAGVAAKSANPKEAADFIGFLANSRNAEGKPPG